MATRRIPDKNEPFIPDTASMTSFLLDRALSAALRPNVSASQENPIIMCPDSAGEGPERPSRD